MPEIPPAFLINRRPVSALREQVTRVAVLDNLHSCYIFRCVDHGRFFDGSAVNRATTKTIKQKTFFNRTKGKP